LIALIDLSLLLRYKRLCGREKSSRLLGTKQCVKERGKKVTEKLQWCTKYPFWFQGIFCPNDKNKKTFLIFLQSLQMLIILFSAHTNGEPL